MDKTKEEINELAKSIDAEELCNYCIYGSDCPKSIVCYGGEPSFPPCSEREASEYFDYESYLEDQEEDN